MEQPSAHEIALRDALTAAEALVADEVQAAETQKTALNEKRAELRAESATYTQETARRREVAAAREAQAARVAELVSANHRDDMVTESADQESLVCAGEVLHNISHDESRLLRCGEALGVDLDDCHARDMRGVVREVRRCRERGGP